HHPVVLKRQRYCFFVLLADTATAEIYTLSLHDALPILREACVGEDEVRDERGPLRLVAPERERALDAREHVRLDGLERVVGRVGDRKSTRLNSSHVAISYAVFCLKKKSNAFDTLLPTAS